MKIQKTVLLTIGLILYSIVSFSQVDSTTIYFKGIENKDLNMICKLTDIQIVKVYSEDTLLRGKVFNIIIKEFKKGKIKSSIDLKITAEKQRIPMIINGDTVIYEIDYTDKTGFGATTKSLTLTFAGLLKNDEFDLNIKYPGMNISLPLNGKSNYSLKKVNTCNLNSVRLPIDTIYPILAYTPPFDTGTEVQSYCLLGEENVIEWYEKYKIKHYYVIYLEIK